MSFTPNGRFEFRMPNAKSAGKYKYADGTIQLNYDSVDGQKINFPMRKRINLEDDGGSFVIDSRFTYRRQAR